MAIVFRQVESKIKQINYSIFFLLMIVLSSCSVLIEGSFGISDISPCQGLLTAYDTEIFVVFTQEVNKITCENAFSLLEDGRAMPGRFEWFGTKLVFKPYTSFSNAKNYTLKVNEGAESINGISLDKRYEVNFETKKSTIRPNIISISPDHNLITAMQDTCIHIVFDKEMDFKSCLDGISISPKIQGYSELINNGREYVFLPLELYSFNTDYSIRISTSVSDIDQNHISEEKIERFHFGTETIEPFLIKCTATNYSTYDFTNYYNIDYGYDENMITKTDFNLLFSEKVLISSVKNCLSFRPSVEYEVVSGVEYSDIINIKLKKRLDYNTLYTISLRNAFKDTENNIAKEAVIYRFLTNNSNCKNIEIKKIGFQIKTSVDTLGSYQIFDCTEGSNIEYSTLNIDPLVYPVNDTTKTASVLYYFSTAFDNATNTYATLSIYQILDKLQVPGISNGCISLIPVSAHIETNQDLVEGNLICVNVQYKIINTIASGIITFSIKEGIEDSFGNKMIKSFSLPLVK